MTVTVLEHPLSPYAQKVKLALHYKNIPFTVEHPIGTADLDTFLSVSPRGEVPALIHEDRSLYQSSVIGAYIDETWPDPHLLPSDSFERAQVRLIEDVMDTHFEANTWALGEILVFGRAEGAEADRLCKYAEDQIRGWYKWLEPRLSKYGWFNGDSYGWGDICVVPFVNGASRSYIAPSEGTRLAEWHSRINKRDDVKKVAKAALEAVLDPVTMKAAIAGGFKREYRDHRLEWMLRAGGIDVVSTGLAAGNIRFNGSFA